MKTYIAKLIFNINIDQGHNRSKFDEQVRLIKANNMPEAIEKAKNIGEAEESSFISPQQHLIKWEFISIIDIYEIEAMNEGQQLYSYSIYKKDAGHFIQYVKEKYKQIMNKNIIFV
jgi:Domain of unknown function (DUF4288)